MPLSSNFTLKFCSGLYLVSLTVLWRSPVLRVDTRRVIGYLLFLPQSEFFLQRILARGLGTTTRQQGDPWQRKGLTSHEGLHFRINRPLRQEELETAFMHLLARRGMAERTGNLLGRLMFSDDQLQRTQKGLKDAGVAISDFGNVGNELACEINEEHETEDERRDRLLLESEPAISALQCAARRYLVRRNQNTLRIRLRLTERHMAKFQAASRKKYIQGGTKFS
ncbi:hypothetical protein C8F04DRAFT_1354508 [Mycena alexandri]|uniref:Uncharacterized protein n=1 Tax=Mycena alexandri TaxID=1745969 RepID=A0AAD6X625_9AGAR|nr:hypothetical protein C8F04DRAFT_1354508 [Mycena alexandri]